MPPTMAMHNENAYNIVKKKKNQLINALQYYSISRQSHKYQKQFFFECKQ